MHNLNNIKKISYLVGNKEIYNKSIIPYDITVCEFLEEFFKRTYERQ